MCSKVRASAMRHKRGLNAATPDQSALSRELLELPLGDRARAARQARDQPAAGPRNACRVVPAGMGRHDRRRERRIDPARAAGRHRRRVRHGRAVSPPAGAARVLPRARALRRRRRQFCIAVPRALRSARRHRRVRRIRVDLARVLPRSRGGNGATPLPRNGNRRARRRASTCSSSTSTRPSRCSSRAAARIFATFATSS